MTAYRVSCACGKVACEATGAPILTTVCYCDDCQRGGHQIEALPDAAPVLDADGGTAYVLYRKDRFACTKGSEWLRDVRLKETSPMRRVVAGCCNTAMYADFGKGHWVSAYRTRFEGVQPPIQMRIQTRFKPQPDTTPSEIPTYRSFGPRLIVKLLSSRIAMLFS